MPTTMNMMPQFPSTNITTEQIQKYLDENKTLILAILDNQNLGKLAECAQYQAQLQKNLMYLAAIADAQPPTQQAMPPQMPPHSGMQQGVNYMQQPQGAVPHQPSGFPPKSPLQFTPQQMQEHQRQQQLQHQQAFQGHLSIRPGVSNGLQGMHSEGNLGGSSSVGGPSSTVGSAGLAEVSRGGAGPGASAGTLSSSMDAREGNQDGAEGVSGDGQGNQTVGNNSAHEDLSSKKGSDDGK